MANKNSAATVAPTANKTLEEHTFRFYRDGDIPALVALINAAYEADGVGSPTSENELTANYNQPFSEPERQVILAESPQGKIHGFARAVCVDDADGNERLYQMRVRIDPAAGGKGLEQALAVKMMGNIRANEQRPELEPRGKVSLLAMTRQEDAPGRALLEKMGLLETRHGWTMERSLDLPIGEPKEIDGVNIRNYRRPEDNPSLLLAYNNSFIDHFEFHALTQEIIDYIMGNPNTRPDLSWVGEIDTEPGKLAGFCICEINEQENARSNKKEGWIAELGTVRGWRGIGLGRSLLLHGLRSLKDAGMQTALLGVDSESLTGANRLYESAGFTVRHHEILYKCLLSDARM